MIMEHENQTIDKNELSLLHQDAAMRLEWHKLTEHLSQCARLTHSQKALAQLNPWLSRAERDFFLESTKETLLLYEHGLGLDLLPFDWEMINLPLRQGALLPPLGLYHILTILHSTNETLQFFKQERLKQWDLPNLRHLVSQLKPQKILLEQLRRSVNEQGEILSSASQELKSARSRLETSKRRIMDHLERLLNHSHIKEALQDSMWVVRDGRYVLPVRTDRKSNVDGISRGISQSGSTIFIEPTAIANEYQLMEQAQSDVEIEIHKIIRELSSSCYKSCQDIQECAHVLTSFDLIFARSRFAQKLEASCCQFVPFSAQQQGFQFSFLKAKHPLFVLENKMCVPNDLILDQHRVWVISGPNAGGKTVAMKTIGLYVMMAQAGLFLPCQTPRCLDFQNVFVELGDRQSREDDLSSFSGHLLQMKKILQHTGPGTLILLDEAFIGTDPAIGMALARATLESLADKQATVIITTHFSNLKHLSDHDSRFFNASMEFEPTKLIPTYKLLNGIPGQSYALELAVRMHLDPDLISKARGYWGSEAQRMENLLKELQEKRIELEDTLQQQKKQEQQLAKELDQLELERKKLEENVESLVENYVNQLQKKFNAFENRLEINKRQFEKEKEFLLRNLRQQTAQAAQQQLQAPEDHLVHSDNHADKKSKQKIDVSPVKQEKKEKVVLSGFDALDQFKFDAQHTDSDHEPQSKRMRKPSQSTKRDLLEEAQESLDFMKRSFKDIEKKFQQEADQLLNNETSQARKEKKLNPSVKTVPLSFWKKGVRVKCNRFAGTGVVLNPADNKGYVECQFGIVKIKVLAAELTAV